MVSRHSYVFSNAILAPSTLAPCLTSRRNHTAFHLHVCTSPRYLSIPLALPHQPDPAHLTSPLSRCPPLEPSKSTTREQCAAAPPTGVPELGRGLGWTVQSLPSANCPKSSVGQAAGWKLAWTWAATSSTCSGESACRVTWRAGRRAPAARTGMPFTSSSRSQGSRATWTHRTG
jgi:hypothetical protein